MAAPEPPPEFADLPEPPGLPKKVKLAGIIAGSIILVVLSVGLLLSPEYEVTRSVEVGVPVPIVDHYVGDLKRWDKWTPWTTADETIVVTLGKRSAGTGASQSWTGKSGRGDLTFTEADPETGIVFDMHFDDNPKTQMSSIRYEELSPTRTRVTWHMKGEVTLPVVGPYLALLMDRMVGPMFEQGLKNLKKVAEAERGLDKLGGSDPGYPDGGVSNDPQVPSVLDDRQIEMPKDAKDVQDNSMKAPLIGPAPDAKP